MTVPVETNMRDQEADSWVGVDLEWRTPPPPSHNTNTTTYGSANGFNGSRKRAWDDVATPEHERLPDMNWDPELELLPVFDSNTTSATFDNTPALSLEHGNGALPALDDDVEEIPRTKMQTGCIPCL